ncbi:MAG TPA: hypothetical protein VLN44_06000, partial [Pyrinomonadaceae bacterium]|nr:hypothetical protein [Pyrinomonadaceae bacterium]
MLCLAASFSCGIIAAQEKSPPPPRSSLCNRESALTIIEQQIDFTKTFADDVARITVLLRSADLIWPFEEKRARTVYADALDLATRNHNEKGDELTPEGKILIREADPRYTVIGAIAKHDSAWAGRLTEQLLKAEQQAAEDKVTRDAQADVTTAERLLTLASSLISSNESIAVSFARETFRYPATSDLSAFLYRFAVRDKSAADEFYREALAAYANAPIERLLYLSSYPFGNDREAGEMPGYMTYNVPEGFVPNPNLQRSFVQAILRRAQNFVENPYHISGGTRVSDPEEMWLALTRLQAQIQKLLPDLAAAVESAIDNLAAKLSPNQHKELRRKIDDDSPPKKTFDEQVEAALRNPNVDRRDEQLTLAILHQSNDEALDHVLDALDKIADSSLRQPLLNWIYFDRAQRAIKDQKLDEARKFAAK